MAISASSPDRVITTVPHKPAPLPTLTYRPITTDDYDLLVSMRKVCGWGEGRVKTYLDPEGGYDIYLFYMKNPEIKDGKIVGGGEGDEDMVVGMGGVILNHADKTIASPEDHLVQITSLFIYPHLQSLRIGSQMMVILEDLCKTHYQAKAISIMTTCYEDVYAREGEYSRVAKWYLKMGYTQWQPPQMVPYPGDVDASRTHYAIYLKKELD